MSESVKLQYSLVN